MKRFFTLLKCFAAGHNLRAIGYPEPGSKQVVHYGCTRCKMQWGMNHRVQCVLPWRDVAPDEKEIWGYDPHPDTVRARLNEANWHRNPV